ncbi:hypothetical protein KAR91_56145 [Candidatus Pacearchaeota archaeon]|nr:hypothetical protein [Candidatus Pacearchaeota archaeon]
MNIALSTISILAVILTFNFLGSRQDELSGRIVELENKVEKMLPREVILTAYSSEIRQTNSDPYQTAFMVPVKRWSVATSRDLLLEGWTPGLWVYLFEIVNGRFKGIGAFQIRDLMHERKKEQFDVWVPNTKFAKKLGRKNNVKAVLLKF